VFDTRLLETTLGLVTGLKMVAYAMVALSLVALATMRVARRWRSRGWRMLPDEPGSAHIESR
jgi:hypothetical protein